jgi:hypothetical protein
MENSTQVINQGANSTTGVNLDLVIHGENVEGSRNLEAITVYTTKISYIVYI